MMARKQNLDFIKLLPLLLLLSFLFLAPPGRAQDEISQIFITGIDAAQFTNVGVQIRVIDAFGRVPVMEAIADQVQLFEEGNAIAGFEVTQGPRTPIVLYFVIDMGFFNQYGSPLGGGDYGTVREEIVRKSLLRFIESDFFQDGDRIHLYLQVNNQNGVIGDQLVRLPEVSTPSDFYERLGSVDLSSAVQGVATQGLSAVETALDDIPDSTLPGGVAIIYVGRLLERSAIGDAALEAQQLANAAADKGVHIYTFHTDRAGGAEDSQEALRKLAGSGERYIRLANDLDNSSQIDSIYRQIVERAGTFTLTYVSQAGHCGRRDVVVIPAGTRPETAEPSEMFTYEACPAAPTIELVTPAEISREVVQSGDSWRYEPATMTATLTVDYPEWPEAGVLPAITGTALLFNGQNQEYQPTDLAGHIIFDISLEEIETSGQFPLQASVTDSLGNTTTITEALSIQVDSPPQPPTPTPTPTPAPPPAGPSTEIIVGSIATGFILLATIVAGGQFLIRHRRRRKRQPPGPAGLKDATPTIVVGNMALSKPFATLSIVVARKEFVGKVIEIRQETLRIGRDPAKTDVQLYELDAESTVSREHCTMQRRPNGSFVITARSLTKVNDEFIPLHQDYPLQKGAKIVLGDIFNQGAELIFNDPKMTDIFGLDNEQPAEVEADATENNTAELPVSSPTPGSPSADGATVNIAGTLEELRKQRGAGQ